MKPWFRFAVSAVLFLAVNLLIGCAGPVSGGRQAAERGMVLERPYREPFGWQLLEALSAPFTPMFEDFGNRELR